jgi:hypothetical protein
MSTKTAIFSAGILCVSALPLLGSLTLISDDFEHENATRFNDANSATDTSWWMANEAHQGFNSLSVVEDPLGSNALLIDMIQRGAPFIGAFPSFTLANIGDTITFSLSVRQNQNSTGAIAGGFNFGLYHDPAPQTAGDNNGDSTNATGYWLSLGSPGGTNLGVTRFHSDLSGTGELFTGSPSYAGSDISDGIAPDNDYHDVTFTIERTGAEELTLSASWTGSTVVGGGTMAPLAISANQFTFNSVAISHGTSGDSKGKNYYIDNISVIGTPPRMDAIGGHFGAVRFIEFIDELTYPGGTFKVEPVATGDIPYLDFPAIIDRSGNERAAKVNTPDGSGSFSSEVPALLAHSNLSFDLSGDVVLDVIDYKGVPGANPRSMAAWIRPNVVNGNQYLVERGAATGGAGARWSVRLDDARLRVEVAGGFAIAEAELTANTWSHIAVTFDGSDVTDANL